MKEYTILIVDDQPENLQTMYDSIKNANANYKVIRAINGKIAYEAVIKREPDLIIVDWDMPEMNGIDLIRELKQNKDSADIPVIMCTGVMTSSKNLEAALDAGAVDYIRKPVDEIELIARIGANLHLAEKYREVKELNGVKDRIFSIIAHDLRGPVGTIKSFAELIKVDSTDYIEPETTKMFIGYIEEQSNKILNTLENLLKWAQSQSNAINFHAQKQTLFNVIISNILLLRGAAMQKNICIDSEVTEKLTATFDSNLISTVIRNLLNNAIKFTPKNGKINVKAEEGEKFHTISIIDTGIGISPEKAKKLFNKTNYETTYGTDNEKGSGIGLKLCLDFVERNGGKIWVESNENSGSIFKFTLPV